MLYSTIDKKASVMHFQILRKKVGCVILLGYDRKRKKYLHNFSILRDRD